MSMQSASSQQNPISSSRLHDLLREVEALGDRILVQQSPVALPESFAESLVRWTPWVSLVFLLPVSLFVLCLSLGASVVGGLLGVAHGAWSLIAAINLALTALSLPGLFRRTRRGWALLVASRALALLQHLLALSVLGAALSALCLWAAFQIKKRYA
jgi:hypothetical protein